MRNVPDNRYGLGLRPHYEPAELDREFGGLVARFLRSRHQKVEFPISTDDLTVLIESHGAELDLYADLTPHGATVEGLTLFMPGEPPRVLISEHLSDERRENRLRTTLAHEFGHLHLHRHVVELAVAERRIDVKNGGRVSCPRETLVRAPTVDWREWQAGYASGAVLMPARRARELVDAWWSGRPGYVPGAEAALVEAVVAAFRVSKDAATVRLKVLKLI